ncbi:hypothetical protein M9H77_11589 [Catharanthus roseus]|uniref:Uncharacterized protein n=1 Tax=Catharanthus roseus TaxID=4058 RepID=A0ACC0BEY4_CATRO|nr:hypothetical protein M9H77_11589 [Catharanthus roseus]
MDPNLWNVRMTMRVPSYYEVHPVTQMVSDEPSMLYSTINNDDDEVERLDGDDDVSSQSESDDNNDPEEGEFQTPLNPVNPVNPIIESIVQQWESSQWFSSARYDCTHSGAFLDMGSGSPIDDLVESGTVRLLDWNDSMTDIQLGMRFVDKVQAISAVQIQERNVDACIYLIKLDLEKWTLLHDGGHRYSIMTTNISEALNSVLKKARVLPLKALVELIFNKLVKYFHQHREEAENCVHPFPTRIFDKFLRIKMKSR